MGYKPLAEEALRRIDVGRIRGLAGQLGSDDPAVRAGAIEALRKETGLDFHFDPNAPDAARGRAVRRWTQYAEHLREAVEVKLPKVLEPPHQQNKHHRAWAADYLGTEAPHPAFVGILKTVVANGAEEEYTRIKSLKAVSRIPHEGLVEYFIGQLDGPLAGQAWLVLRRITQAGIANDNDDWADVKRRYEQWWRKNRETFVYDHDKAMWE